MSAEPDLSSAVPPPPNRTLRGEDAPLPLRENNNVDPWANLDPFNQGGAAACGDMTATAAAPAASRAGANVVAALNFNAKRVPFSPFNEETPRRSSPVATGTASRRCATRRRAR